MSWYSLAPLFFSILNRAQILFLYFVQLMIDETPVKDQLQRVGIDLAQPELLGQGSFGSVYKGTWLGREQFHLV